MKSSSASEACRNARELGRRLAAAAALLVALVSLLQHAPVWLACLRGGTTLFALVLATRLGTAALAKAIQCDRARLETNGEGRP